MNPDSSDEIAIRRVRADDGVAIAYRATGDGHNVIVMLHGWGGSGTGGSWRGLLTHLHLAGRTMVAIDLRGHGASDKPEQRYTLDRCASDVMAVADDVGAERFVVVGASMGGRLAQWLACRHESRLRGQFLIAPVPADPLPLSDDTIESWARQTRSLQAWTEFLKQFSATPMAKDVVEDFFADVSRASDWAKRETLRMCGREGFSHLLPGIDVPTLVLAGRHDRMLPPQLLVEGITRRIPHARLLTVDAGHEIARENPQAVAVILEEFLAGLAD